MLNQNQRSGKIDHAKGKAKQAAGKFLGDEDLVAEGQADETVGSIETAVGNATHKAGDLLVKAGKAVKR